MSSSKTFRLFISSTFSDFKKEREILQTRVFPKVKEHCQENGYSFQPIDLRWGVSNEAQLDQKTLELCLSEVRACKSNPYPNFLVMFGDRYGWVPVPYAIEAKEFETLLESMEPEERDSLLEWYKQDLNELPASYILKERSGIYAEYDNWESVEKKIRDTLQKAVNGSTLDEEQRAKYFLSATEAEVQEGIIPYAHETPFQEKKLLCDNRDLKKIEPQHLFGFFRNIDKTTAVSDKFIKDDYDKAQEFKERAKSVFIKVNIEDNILEVSTTQKDKESLDESYLTEFEEKTITFLIFQIDSHIKKETQENLTPLKKETDAQLFFAQQKREDFLGQEETLKTIAEYLQGESKKPFVLNGASGGGKSSIMAKAIEQATTNNSAKILYRFVGATPNASSSKEILLSLFNELGKDIRHASEKHQEPETELILDANKESESFEDFSYRVYDEFANIKEDVVFFIDAVDQLSHDENFLWLREELPSNIKIVLSALDDANYKDDSRYFQTLKTKTNNIHEIPPFLNPEKLLFALLEKEGRTIQQNQFNYFLKQYETSSSPLYVTVAAQEIKNWKSYDYMQGEAPKDGAKEQDLRSTQKGIIEEYIENLTSLYHQESAFVQKVLGYIYASRDGLSESELLELINTDKEFVEKMAPETYHENTNKELPLVHWSRLQTQLKPFLSIKKQDNEELMYFFHREFEEVIANLPNQKEEHVAIIKATQKLIKQNQEKPFEQNRWGKLYATLITEYELRYKKQEKLQEYAEFVAKLESKEWVDSFLKNTSVLGLNHNKSNRMFQATTHLETAYHSTKILYKENIQRWANEYTQSLNNLAASYHKQNSLYEAIKLNEEAFEITEVLYKSNHSRWVELYLIYLTNLAKLYYEQNRLQEAIKLGEKALGILKPLYQDNSIKWLKLYVTNLNDFAIFNKEQNLIDTAVELEEESLGILKPLYKENSGRWAGMYTNNLNNLALSYKNKNRIDEAIKLEKEALGILKPLYKENSGRWADLYTNNLNNLALFYSEQNCIDEAMELEKETLGILKPLYKENSGRWAHLYINNLNNLALSYKNKNRIDEAMELEKEALGILKPLYKENSERWAHLYINNLNLIAISFLQQNKKEISYEIVKIIYKIAQKHFGNTHHITKTYINNYINIKRELRKDNKESKNANILIIFKKLIKYFKKVFL